MRRGPELAPLREVIQRHGLRTDKRLGQHFLLDPNILARIAAVPGDLAGRAVLEVGPGPGGLTRALLATDARRVIAIERDPRCIAALEELAARAGPRLSILEADALAVDLADLGEARLTIVANLPYNIGTHLLLSWLGRLEHIEAMVLMFQQEVARRLIACPGSGDYGRLSVLVQWLCRARLVMQLPAGAFLPPPKVASSLVELIPRPEAAAPADKRALERVLAAAFGQRRKMLRSSLKALTREPERLLEVAGITPSRRAEEIDVEGFCRLAQAWAELRAAEPQAG